MEILLLEKSKLLIIIKTMSSKSIPKEAEIIKVNNQLKTQTYFWANLEIRHSVR